MAPLKDAAAPLHTTPAGEQFDPAAVADRLAQVRSRIGAAGGDPDEVRIVAVTKGFGPEAVGAASLAGLVDVGENYAQELLSKSPLSPPGMRWHFLGSVQRNKVRRLAPLVTAWHGVDRRSVAESIAASAPGARIFVEVNLTLAAGRPGCRPEDLDDLIGFCRGLPLDVAGLMTVAAQGDPESARASFRWLASSARRLGLRDLSMGMSDDFEVAVQEGATTLRLGRVLFGPRPSRGAVQR
jgi:uncharacterized pyridoxal phosphate-containing UPF0001 family protein